MKRSAILMALLLCSVTACAQQVADTTFDTRVARPAFTDRHPRVVVDEAHHNFHTATGRYQAFASLVRNDGCALRAGTTRFTASDLATMDLLVISNALGAPDMADSLAGRSAFDSLECDAVRDWVSGGGALLLIADHAPMGSAASALAGRFGVGMRNGYTIDTAQAVKGNFAIIDFTPGRGLDTTHAIMRGRDASERVRHVITFAGQSLSGPPGSVSLITFSAAAEDLQVGLGGAHGAVSADRRRSAAGRSQALVFPFGKGRVVVMGEAAMLSAQLTGRPGINQQPMGMNVPGIDNRQLALNIVRWLTGALD